jgi:hypothetical protein
MKGKEYCILIIAMNKSSHTHVFNKYISLIPMSPKHHMTKNNCCSNNQIIIYKVSTFKRKVTPFLNY